MDELAPIAATVAVDRRAPVKSSRSTLATMADLEPYLAGLFGREAIPTCPECGLDAIDTSPRDAAARLAETHQGARAIVTYAIGVDDAEQFLELRERLARTATGGWSSGASSARSTRCGRARRPRPACASRWSSIA